MYFSNVQNPGTFGVPYQILRDTGAQLFRTHKTTIVPGKPRLMESLSTLRRKQCRNTNHKSALRISNLVSNPYISNASQVSCTHARTHTHTHNHSFTPQHSCTCFWWTWPHYVRETMFHPYAQLSHLWVDDCAATHAA